MVKKKSKKRRKKIIKKELTKCKKNWIKFAQFLLTLLSTITLVFGSVYIGLSFIENLNVNHWTGIAFIVASILANLGYDKIENKYFYKRIILKRHEI